MDIAPFMYVEQNENLIDQKNTKYVLKKKE